MTTWRELCPRLGKKFKRLRTDLDERDGVDRLELLDRLGLDDERLELLRLELLRLDLELGFGVLRLLERLGFGVLLRAGALRFGVLTFGVETFGVLVRPPRLRDTALVVPRPLNAAFLAKSRRED